MGGHRKAEGGNKIKQYGVKCGRDLPGESVFANLAQAKRHMKQLKHADDAYDIPRSDGYYKIVEREVGPWRIVKEETK